VANNNGRLFSLPFNMNTFYQLWGISDPAEVMEKIAEQSSHIKVPKNLEEQAIKSVGRDVYELLIKGYTEKQWGRSCRDLPASIIKRLPVRLTFDNNYFNDKFCGIPQGGYNKLIEGMLAGIECRTNVDYHSDADYFNSLAKTVVYTGTIDRFFNYEFGALEYRSLRFETKVVDANNYQGCPVMNYTGKEVDFTRVIEHKWFENGPEFSTVITWEYPCAWEKGKEQFYPVNSAENQQTFARYAALAEGLPNLIFGGRLGQYRYYDMHQVIAAAMHKVSECEKSHL
jgi:UDP-galactopyranose mutase